MNEYDRYKFLLGETVILYQMMENDLKLIYAGMLGGNFFKNVENVRSMYKGLGQVIMALEELDNTNRTPYFTKETYNTRLTALRLRLSAECHAINSPHALTIAHALCGCSVTRYAKASSMSVNGRTTATVMRCMGDEHLNNIARLLRWLRNTLRDDTGSVPPPK